MGLFQDVWREEARRVVNQLDRAARAQHQAEFWDFLPFGIGNLLVAGDRNELQENLTKAETAITNFGKPSPKK